MKIEELKKLHKTAILGDDVSLVCEHIDALLAVAEAAQKVTLHVKNLSSYEDDWMYWLCKALKELEAVK